MAAGDFTPASKVSIGILGAILATVIAGLAGMGALLWRGGAYFGRIDTNFEGVQKQLGELSRQVEEISNSALADRWTATEQTAFVKRLVRELHRVHPDLELDEANL